MAKVFAATQENVAPLRFNPAKRDSARIRRHHRERHHASILLVERNTALGVGGVYWMIDGSRGRQLEIHEGDGIQLRLLRRHSDSFAVRLYRTLSWPTHCKLTEILKSDYGAMGLKSMHRPEPIVFTSALGIVDRT